MQMKDMVAKGIYWLTNRLWIDRVRKKHLGRLCGAENLPDRGPYVIVANHASFMDHFILAALFRALHGEKIYFLTKKESFETPWSRWWHEAMGAIPIDREGPGKDQIRCLKGLLRKGKILVIYPEGTRSDGDVLLPFKPGAFKIAARMGVGIIPVGLVGSSRVLPKGKWLPRSGRVDVAIGAGLETGREGMDNGDALQRTARRALMSLAFGEERPSRVPERERRTRAWLLSRVEQGLEAILEEGLQRHHRDRLRHLWEMLDLCPDSVHRQVIASRIQGLLSMTSPLPISLWHGLRALALANRVLRRDPRNPMAHYVVAMFYQSLPVLRRWRRQARRMHLAQAHFDASVYGYREDTFQLAYAQALMDVGERERAAALLAGLLDSLPDRDVSPRLARRERRAQQMLSLLQASNV